MHCILWNSQKKKKTFKKQAKEVCKVNAPPPPSDCSFLQGTMLVLCIPPPDGGAVRSGASSYSLFAHNISGTLANNTFNIVLSYKNIQIKFYNN